MRTSDLTNEKINQNTVGRTWEIRVGWRNQEPVKVLERHATAAYGLPLQTCLFCSPGPIHLNLGFILPHLPPMDWHTSSKQGQPYRMQPSSLKGFHFTRLCTDFVASLVDSSCSAYVHCWHTSLPTCPSLPGIPSFSTESSVSIVFSQTRMLVI